METRSAWFSNAAIQFALLLAIAFALRAYTFGDPNLHMDEAFYFTAGNAMHQGALPYVDVWDRKPFGLFLIYYLIAGLSSQPAAYQIAATLFAAATALCIARLAGTWSNGRGGLLAGACYLFLLATFQGFGGQTPVFYNLFVALAALLVVRALPQLREGKLPLAAMLAMLSAGFALTIKTTALFEAAFLGLFALFALPALERLGKGASLAAIGAIPAVSIMAGYALAGHFAEYWQAMTGANLSTDRWDPYSAQIRVRIMIGTLAPLLALAGFGWLDLERGERRFMALWIAAALVGLAAYPYFYLHYALPVLVPLCVAAGPFLGRKWVGALAAIGLCGYGFYNSPTIDPVHTALSKARMEQVAAAITNHSNGRQLLVYEGPPFLYTMTGQPFPSPLAFPAHLYHLIERDVSHLGTLAEVERVIADRPGVVVMTSQPRDGPLNAETYAVVDRYVRENCRLVAETDVYERFRSDHVLVWGDCH